MGPSAKCPTCDRVLEKQYNRLIKKFEQEISQKNKIIESIHGMILKLEQDYNRISREKQALQKKQSFLQNQEIKKEKLTTSIENADSEIKEDLHEIQQKKRLILNLHKIVFDEQKYLAIKIKVEEIYKKYQSSLEIFTKKRNQLEILKIQKERTEGEKNLIIQQMRTLEQKIEEQKKLLKRLEIEKRDTQQLKMTNEIMLSFRTYLISQIRPTLSQYASMLFEQLTDGKYKEIELDEDYNILLYDNGTPYKIERFSGGEEDLANLCIRLAISEVITERAGSIFQFIILDEIFGSQDAIRRQNIIQALNNLSSKFRQIFLITHIEEIKHFTENIILVIEDENGISTIKIE
jgi:DNA repair protein SbcC/Rad50